ncbi:MAG: amidohydrolase family protein [Steroidobacteraceae bacterium]
MSLVVFQNTHAEPADSAVSKTVVYAGATVIDGDPTIERRNVVIRTQGNQIIAVQPADGFHPESSWEIVDVSGKFVIPGLINTHVHLATSPNPEIAKVYLRRELYSGVTTVRDMAGDARLLSELKREAEFDEIASPDIYYAALMAGPGFFVDPRTHESSRGRVAGHVPWMQAITARTDLRLAVAQARATDATGIKIYADLSAALVKAITMEAHHQNMLVWAHAAVFPARPSDVIDAGVDVVSHADFVAYQLSEHMPESFESMTAVDPRAWHAQPEMTALFKRMRTRGTILDATIDVGYRYPSSKWPAGMAAFITGEAYRQGVNISTGTDDDPDWTDTDSVLDSEIVRLVRDAGMTPADVIRSATVIGARTVGQKKTRVAIDAGKLANMVVLNKNPLDDIDNIRSIAFVVKHGIRYQRSQYKPVSVEEMKRAAH